MNYRITKKGNVVTKKIEISDSQILLYGSSPIEVVPAQGNGKVILPLGAYVEYRHNTQPYTMVGACGLTHQPSSGSLPLSFAGLLGYSFDYAKFAAVTGEGYMPNFSADNQPLYFTSDDSSDPASGDGTVVLCVSYMVIEL